MKIKTKFTLIVSILIAIYSLIALFAFSNYKKSIKDIIAQQQFSMISIVADEIDNKLLTAHKLLIAAAKTTPPDVMLNSARAQAFLDEKYGLHAIFDSYLFLFTPAGKIFVESPDAPGRRGLDFSFREYISNTIKTKKPYISDPFVSLLPDKHPVVAFTVPFFDSKGKIKGILVGSINLMRDNFLGRICNVKIGVTGNIYLYETDGTMIMHQNKKRILVKQPRGLNRLYDMARDGFEGTGETTTSYGLKAVSSFKRLKTKNWILAANTPQAEAYHPIQVAERYFLIASIAGSIAAFFIFFVIMKYLIKPLELLTRHVEDLPHKTGDDRFLNIKAKDEIGTLSAAFDKMESERKQTEELLRSLSNTDELTGLANRRAFDLFLDEEWRRALRDRRQISIMMIDVDLFKKYNDTYGHLKGDACLKSVAKVLESVTRRAGDKVARFGGEEFIVLLSSVDYQHAVSIAEKTRMDVEALRIPHEKSDINAYLTISIGVVSIIPQQNMSWIELIKSADEALYRAKEEGRNRIAI